MGKRYNFWISTKYKVYIWTPCTTRSPRRIDAFHSGYWNKKQSNPTKQTIDTTKENIIAGHHF
jgi:hypothetical protein